MRVTHFTKEIMKLLKLTRAKKSVLPPSSTWSQIGRMQNLKPVLLALCIECLLIASALQMRKTKPDRMWIEPIHFWRWNESGLCGSRLEKWIVSTITFNNKNLNQQKYFLWCINGVSLYHRVVIKIKIRQAKLLLPKYSPCTICEMSHDLHVEPGTNERLLDVLKGGKKQKYAVQNVWCSLLQYFPVLRSLQILSTASSFMCAID